MSIPRIAVLVTCYNRRQTTLSCMAALYSLSNLNEVHLDTFLVDDGCTDGTAQAVGKEYPQVKILQGNGNLYWGGGMRMAWDEAFKADYDYYLWLNDDTMIFNDSLQTLLRTYNALCEQEKAEVIVSGSTYDPGNGQSSYGGVFRTSRFKPMNFELILPSDKPQKCETIHGNYVLISRRVAQIVGNLSSSYSHGLGDFDYGLRAGKLGISCWITPGYLGTCAAHNVKDSYYDKTLNKRERIRKMRSHTGLPPFFEWLNFTWRHAGMLWWYFWMRAIVRMLFPQLWLSMRGIAPT